MCVCVCVHAPGTTLKITCIWLCPHTVANPNQLAGMFSGKPVPCKSLNLEGGGGGKRVCCDLSDS